AYDEVSKQALTPYCDNIHILQGGVNCLEYVERDWFASPFRFIMCGILSDRKNPFAAITAFKNLRDAGELADATLTLKNTTSNLLKIMEQWCPGLYIVDHFWPTAKIHSLYRQSHVMLAPSQGEGKNRPALEFASTGGAVVAPLFGGHAMWGSSDF